MTVDRLAAMLMLASCWMAPAGAASLGSYPDRPIRLIVPTSPGGNADMVARTLGQRLTDSFGKTVIIDNRPGQVGIDLALRSAPDGYSLLMPGPNFYSDQVFRVAVVGSQPLVLVSPPSAPWRNLRELQQDARSSPGKVSYASGGLGTSGHVGMLLLEGALKTDLVHVPYKGSAPALMGLLGGETQVALLTIPAAMARIKDGKLRPLAVTSDKRSALLPDVPTASEQLGQPVSYAIRYAVYAPLGTPRPIADRLNQEITKIVNTPETKADLNKLGIDVAASKGEGDPGPGTCVSGEKNCKCVGCIKEKETCPEKCGKFIVER